MAYFKIGDVDFSHCVNELKVKTRSNYVAQTNAAGNTLVDYINQKYSITVGIIPLNGTDMAALQASLKQFNVSISFRDPTTNKLVSGINCIIPEDEVEYYTIQTNKVMFKAFTITFEQL